VIEAIKIEAAKLKQTLIPEPELSMARNYLMGHLMTQLDGPFATLDFIKSMKIERLKDETFSDLVTTIQQITSEELRELAVRYLDLDQWVTIVIK